MHGFITIISLNKGIPALEFEWKPLFSFQPAHVKREQIDEFMGSCLNSRFEHKANISYGNYSTGLLHKSEKIIQKSISKYRNDELYNFYNRAFLGFNNGHFVFDLIGVSISAFTYIPFATYAFSIPRKEKYKRRIYVKWIKTKHPEYADFIWESIGGKPTNNKFLKFLYRLKRAIIKRLPFKSMWKKNMNPEQLWYDENLEVKIYLDDYFKKNINKFEFQKDLMDDMTMLYNKGNITEKTQVLTLLAAYKLLFE